MIRVLELQLEWNTFSLDDDINFVEIVEIEGDDLGVALDVTWCEEDRDLELVSISLRVWHEYLARSEENVEVWLLLEIGLNADGAAVDVVDDKHLLEGYWLTRDEAWPEVHSGRAELDTGLASTADEEEVILGATHNLELELVALEVVLTDWQVRDLELLLSTLWYASSLWGDGDVLVHLALPDEVKVELTIVLDDDSLGLPLVDEEFTEVELVGLSGHHLHAVGACEDGMVDLVTLSFHVQYEWTGLPLHVADEVVVVVELIFWLE